MDAVSSEQQIEVDHEETVIRRNAGGRNADGLHREQTTQI